MGNVADLDKVAEHETLALALTPEGYPDLAIRHTNLAATYTARFHHLGELNDIHKSIKHGLDALKLTPENDPHSASRHANLGTSFGHRFKRLGELEDNDQSIVYTSRALELTPQDHPALARRYADLAVSYIDRFRRVGNLNDLQKSIEHKVHALELTPEGDPGLASQYAGLGILYNNRFRRLGDLGDLQKSIEHCFCALVLTPEGHPDLANRHTNLGIFYNDRFQRLLDLNDLQKSIEHELHALELTPQGHPHLANVCTSLGISFTHRFERLGDLEDLQKAIEQLSRALELTLDGDPELASRHASLGVSLGERFQRLGDQNDLQKSIENLSRALDLTPNGHPAMAGRHANLGAAYTDRFRCLDDLNDLQRSIEHKIYALKLTPQGDPNMASRHANLGVSYTDRFQRLGHLSDLERSIGHKLHALQLTPEGDPERADQHAYLGVSYTDRFQRLGDLNDLQKSIEQKWRALELTAEGDPELARRYASLGVSFGERFRHLNNQNDLQRSIEHLSRAVQLTPSDHPDLADRHANLAVAYADRFRTLRSLNDLQHSIENKIHAFKLTPEGHPDLASRHAALGISFRERFRHLGDPADLQLIIKHETRALALTPEDHPSFPDRHFKQALTYCLHYKHTGDASYLARSLDSFRTACQTLVGSPRSQFLYALMWTRRASQYASLGRIEAYQTAIDLLPQFIWLGASTHQRYYDLSTTESLAVNAAFVAIRHSNPDLALEWLEHARCVVWSQNLMLRSPLDDLESAHPDLAARLQTISKQLHHTSSEPRTSHAFSYGPTDPEIVAHNRRHLAQEYQDRISQIRKLPTFETFLRPLKSDRLVRAARNGPVIVINCHVDHCDALLILPGSGEVKHLPLPNFSQQKAQNARHELESSLQRRGIRDRGVKFRGQPEHKDVIGSVLLTLWNDIVKLVLDFLGYMENDLTESLPHITWCPTGALSFLPLHAAGDYDHPRSRVYNYAISSYTPTLTALLASVSSPPNGVPQILAIGQSDTPGHTPLPGTIRELAYIRNHSQNTAGYSELTDKQATTAAVLNAMEQHDWVHLACHAHQNVEDPTRSGFFLHDGILDLTSINRRSFKKKGLAFLSACQTATGDEKLPDEAIHLASGMLMAGYPSVIATMWSVHDKDAPLVADKVYAELMKEGKVGNGGAGRALHNAVGVLCDEVGEKEFARWVPYIHIGS